MPRTDAHLDDPVLAGFPLKSGFRIVPPTIIIERLGEGAAAVVYRARHYNLDTDVAVKVLRKDVAANNPDLVARFQREAKLAAQIRQENLLAVLDTTDYNGTHYTVMELVDGESVEGRVQRRGPLSVAEALTVTLQTAKGLAALHAKRVVHRDIKPSNIILSRGGATKLADLGIAKQSEQFDTLATHANAILGTPQYMAPELFESANLAGERSDVYALGLTLAFMLTGEHQHMGKSLPEIIRAVCDGAAFDLSKLGLAVSDELCVLVNRMTAQRQSERPLAREVLQLLSPLLLEVGGQADLADDQANSAFGTSDIPSRLDRDRISEIRAAMSTGFGPAYPPTAAGGYTPTVVESQPIDTGAVRIPADLQMDNRLPVPPTVAGRKAGGGRWLALALVLLLFLLIVSGGALLTAGKLVHGDYLAFTPLADDSADPGPVDPPDNSPGDNNANQAVDGSKGNGAADDKPDLKPLDEILPPDAPATNKPPVISAIAAQKVVAGQTLGPIQFTVTDDTTPTDKLQPRIATDDITLLPSTMVTVIGGISGNAQRSLNIETLPDRTGKVTLTVSAKDAEGLIGEQKFTLEITPAQTPPTQNTPPTITDVPETLVLGPDKIAGMVRFKVTDRETPGDLRVSASSSNNALLPVEGLGLVDKGNGQWTLVLTPTAGVAGKAEVQVVAADASDAQSTANLTLTVERTPAIDTALDAARQFANNGNWREMVDALVRAADATTTAQQRTTLRAAATTTLQNLRRSVPDLDERERLVPGLRNKLLRIAEVSNAPTARLMVVETILRYENPPHGVQLVGIRDVNRIEEFKLALSNAIEAAKAGEIDASVYAGDILTQHQAGRQNQWLADAPMGVEYLRAGAGQGHVPSMVRLGIYLRQAAVQRPEGDLTRVAMLNEATNLLKKAADDPRTPSAAAAHEYAIYLLNYAKLQEPGLDYLRQAARAGYPPAVAGARQLNIEY